MTWQKVFGYPLECAVHAEVLRDLVTVAFFATLLPQGLCFISERLITQRVQNLLCEIYHVIAICVSSVWMQVK